MIHSLIIKSIFRKSNIFILTILFYFTRTVFPGFGYLFIGFAFLTGIYIVKSLKFNKIFFISFLFPLIMYVFVIIGILSSEHYYIKVIKELANGFIIFLIFYQLANYKKNGLDAFIDRFLKLFSQTLLFVGIIAISRAIIFQLGGIIPLATYLFSGFSNAFPLVSDKNFYALYFILATIVVFYLRKNKKISVLFFIASNLIFLINILFSFSRRAYIIYVLFLLVLFVCLYLYRNKNNIRKLIFQYFGLFFSFFLLLLLSIYVLRIQIYQLDKQKGTLSRSLASINAILKPYEKEVYFKKKLWLDVEREYWQSLDYQVKSDSNLFYNGDFSNGTEYWGKLSAQSSDSIVHKLLIKQGIPFLRIERFFGEGYWSLLYKGRPIYYYSNVTYTLSFEYRVIKGNERPFNVGWWIKENGKYQHNLKPQISKIGNSWYQCVIKHKFKDNYINPPCFINSQAKNTIIDVRDIKLFSDDTLHRSSFVDQLNFENQLKPNELELSTQNKLTDERTSRLRYAFKIWQHYGIQQKIFGNGFEYLEKFGEMFYNDSKSFDYPHNPIISAFLYSGIVGGLLYFYFLILTFWYYWKFRKHHLILFILYIVTFLFCMVSGNSHFSVPIFTFLSLVPFYTKYIVRKKFEVLVI